jgi:hypothetical protein
MWITQMNIKNSDSKHACISLRNVSVLKIIFVSLVLYFPLVCFSADSEWVSEGGGLGNIVLHSNGNDGEKIYEGIIGWKDGFRRSLITINGVPALQVNSRFEFYYTLIVVDGELVIDCAYFDGRNIYNGARASAAICGLNTRLDRSYDEIAQIYSNDWRKSIFSFDTSLIVEKGEVADFLLGRIGSVEIYDRYSSLDSLEDAAPRKYIKTSEGCFDFGNAVGFLVFINKDAPRLSYLDVLRSVDPKNFQRLQEADLKALAVERCPDA